MAVLKLLALVKVTMEAGWQFHSIAFGMKESLHALVQQQDTQTLKLCSNRVGIYMRIKRKTFFFCSRNGL